MMTANAMRPESMSFTASSSVSRSRRKRVTPSNWLRASVCWFLSTAMLWTSIALPFSLLTQATPAYAAPAANAPLFPPIAQTPPPVEAVVSRRAPQMNTGRVEGTIRQLLAEDITFNSGAIVTGWLMIPGTPELQLNGAPSFGGTVTGTGNPQPTSHRVRLNSGSSLGKLVNRTDPITLPNVPMPPDSTGTRTVTINTPGQSPGDFATLRHLTLNSNVGQVAVPPGTYGNFTANSGSGFTFGIAGATQPAVYNLQQLTINSNAQVQVVGPVTLNLKGNASFNGNLGAAGNPTWLTLRMADGDVTLNSGANLYGHAVAPSKSVIVNSNTRLKGTVVCDRLTLNGGIVEGFSTSQPPPPVLSSVTPTTAAQGQTLTVTLQGFNTNWVNGQTRANFGGEVSVGGAAYGDLGLVQVTSATTATAQVTISPTAALAPRSVQVITGGESVSLNDVFIVTAATPPGSATATVSTYAGGAGTPGFADGGSLATRFRDLASVAIGANDIVYVADAGNHRIRRVALDGATLTLAGTGVAGFTDGTASVARFNNPQGVAADANGNVFVADTDNHRIRRIDASGNVTTFAGDGTAGFVNGAAATARFNAPRGVATDNSGNVYVADTGNHAVRVINVNGQVLTLAGDGTAGNTNSPGARFNGLAGIAYDNGRLFVYIADARNHRIRQLAPGSTTVTTLAGVDRGFADGNRTNARFAEPSGIAPDGSGRLIVADTINSLIRAVHPEKAINDEAGAVATLAGTGIRAHTDGTGNVARFHTPRGVAVQSSSAIIVADTGNHVLRRILMPPVILSFDPVRALAGANITILGERFDGRAADRNTVRFTRAASAGGGQTTATVVSATRTQLVVTVPADAATGPITVTTEGGTAASPTNFEVLLPPPVITNFTPSQGVVGDTVTLIGTNLKLGNDNPAVTFTGQSAARIPALVTSATPTEVRVIVPNGAVTGVIELTTQGGRATTSGNFIVDTRQDYSITVAPNQINAVQGGTGVAVISLVSPQVTFTQLAKLAVTGLPNGVIARFEGSQITAGARSTLTLLVPGTLTAGSYPFTVRAAAQVDGVELVRTASASLVVTASGQTTLSGRVLNTDKEAVIGATVSLDGQTATTDAAGAFRLTGVTAGQNRPVMVDGRTASAPNRTYPVIVEPANVIAGQANVVPFTFYLPAIDTQYEVTVVPNQNTVVTTPRVPGVAMTIPAGANLRNRDGSPVTRVSITPVPIDRTPAPLPANVGIPLVFTSQPGGAIADIEMPVVYPNMTGKDPNTQMELYAFDHDLVRWYVYGYGRVSTDGKTIQPEINPATGRLYGLRDFSWHGPNPGPGDGNPGSDPCADSGNPVNLSTGMKMESETDISFGGVRGGVTFTRTYTSELAQFCLDCPFGAGMTHNYDIRLNGAFASGGTGRAIQPWERAGRLFSYDRAMPDGTTVFKTQATTEQLGDEIRRSTSGTLEYRDAHGTLMRFDTQGRMVSMSDRNNNTTTLTYANNRLVQITDPVGRALMLEYTNNRITKITDPIGRVWRYTYVDVTTGFTLLASIADPLGNVTRYRYNGRGRLTSITDARGNIVKQVNYDSAGRVVSQRYADGGIETYEYILSGSIVTEIRITDQLGRITSKRFNANGYLIETVDELGQIGKIDRKFGSNLPVSKTGPCGCAERVSEFDERGNTTLQANRIGQTTRTEYDPIFNYPTKITDQRGVVTRFTYDARGNMVSIINALGQVTSFAYDQHGQQTSATDALGHAMQMEYDAHGNVVTQIDALNNRTVYEYDGIGRRTATVDPLGRRGSTTYDALNRVVTETDSNGAVTTYNYDENDNVIGVIDHIGRLWAAEYDQKDRLLSVTDPLGRVFRYEYNLVDETLRDITPGGRAMRYEYDTRGDVVTIIDPIGGVVRREYDNRGNLVTVKDERGNITTINYDELFRPVGSRDPLGRSSVIAYDANGNLAKMTDRLGRNTAFGYDELNRPKQVTFADASAVMTYDTAGRPVRLEDSQGGFVEWGYDDANRILNETTNAGSVTYSYNNADQRTAMIIAGRLPVNYGYDSAGRLNSISQGNDVFIYGYDSLSRRVNLQRPNGITTTYEYDQIDRLSRMQHSTLAGGGIEDYLLSYTQDDEIRSITSLAGASPLPSSKSVASADVANRIAQVGSATYSYDSEGQTIAKSDANGSTQYEWDARGRLSQVTLPGGNNVKYNYDALGRRAKRIENGVTTEYLYDGDDIVLDKTGSSVASEYLNGPGIDDKLRQVSGQGTYYFLTDHLNSTRMLANANGGIVETQSYEAFGQNPGSSLTRYGFTGREKDPTTGLLHYRARELDTSQGRFLTEDPIGFDSGTNWYSYVNNSPLSFIDPEGLSLEDFGRGLVEGGLDSFWAAAKMAFLFGLLTCLAGATGGTAIPLMVAALQVYVSIESAMSTVQSLVRLMQEKCPEEKHFQAGYIIGSLIGGKVGGKAGARMGKYCFLPGTLVRTKTGLKPIEEIKIGDSVLAAEPETGLEKKKQWRKVTNTTVNTVSEVLDIQVAGEVITATVEHPFWVAGEGWLQAQYLQCGQYLYTKDNKQVKIEKVSKRNGEFKVHNFEVEDSHTYYVGSSGVLTHNSCRDDYMGRTPSKKSRTGKDVIDRMRREGKVTGSGRGTKFKSERDGKWYPLRNADMSHKRDAVKYWNKYGHRYGPRSPQVRRWMRDSNNYYLEHFKYNRSDGGGLKDRYRPWP